MLGRVITKIDPDGNEVTLRYDKEGNVRRVDHAEVTRDAATHAVTATRHFAEAFTYDELNRLTRWRTSSGSLRYAYDSRGNQVEITDPTGHAVENVYDAFNRLIESRQLLEPAEPGDPPSPVRIILTYDLDDHKTTQTDALGRTTRFAYDSAGRLAQTVLPDGVEDSFIYDRYGNLTEYRDRNGLIRRLTWDGLNRNTRIEIDPSGLPPGADFAGAVDLRCEYDALGRFTTVRNDFVITRLQHDSLGALLVESTSFTAATGIDPGREFVLHREFGSTGALLGLRYPSGRHIRYTRDVLDRIVRVDQVMRGQPHPAIPRHPTRCCSRSSTTRGCNRSASYARTASPPPTATTSTAGPSNSRTRATAETS